MNLIQNSPKNAVMSSKLHSEFTTIFSIYEKLIFPFAKMALTKSFPFAICVALRDRRRSSLTSKTLKLIQQTHVDTDTDTVHFNRLN